MDQAIARRVIGGLACFILLAGMASAQVTQRTAKPGELVEVKLAKPSAVLVQEPLGLQYRSYVLRDGSSIVVFCTGSHPRIVVACISNNAEAGIPDVKQVVVVVDGDPNPPEPGPTPAPLSEVSKWVRDQGRAAGIDRPLAAAIAGNYETVASIIAAVPSTTTNEAMRRLAELNAKHALPATAKPMIERLEQHFNEKVKDDVRLAGQTMADVAKGFRAI